jgi:hypothetical protein
VCVLGHSLRKVSLAARGQGRPFRRPPPPRVGGAGKARHLRPQRRARQRKTLGPTLALKWSTGTAMGLRGWLTLSIDRAELLARLTPTGVRLAAHSRPRLHQPHRPCLCARGRVRGQPARRRARPRGPKRGPTCDVPRRRVDPSRLALAAPRGRPHGAGQQAETQSPPQVCGPQ